MARTGRPKKYESDDQRRAARAAAARARRANERAAGVVEMRVKRPAPRKRLESDIIALDHIPDHRR